jgi:hypothetical protein
MAAGSIDIMDYRLYKENTMSEHSTELEKRLYDALGKAFWWIEDLAQKYGYAEVLEHCPPGLLGKTGFNEVLKDAEREHPELADLTPGTFVTDGIIRGFVKERTTMPYGRKRIPAYRVYTGSGVDSWIPCCQVRRV